MGSCEGVLGAAHPRSRGENEKDPYSDETLSGSSPLTRGKPSRLRQHHANRRLIPAHAGKTSWLPSWTRRPSAHPRSRGENHVRVRPPPLGLGSSPLTRGKLPDRRGCDVRRRLIPAHAGKTKRSTTLTRICAAHPRSRGENGIELVVDQEKSGSSPLTRGKRRRLGGRRRYQRLIPAHAGKTRRVRGRRSRRSAHPRSRGENIDREVRKMIRSGSSPLTRGKRST